MQPGERLLERELTERYGVARHSVRAAIRALAAERLVTIEPNRGASVARLDEAGLRSLFELRTALELEAAHLALERNGGRLPRSVREAVAALGRTLRDAQPALGARSPRPTTRSTWRSSRPRAATASPAPTRAWRAR